MTKSRWLSTAVVAFTVLSVPLHAQDVGDLSETGVRSGAPPPTAARALPDPAAAVAADVITSILAGDADEAAWTELEAALVGASSTRTEESLGPGTTTDADPVARLAEAARVLGGVISDRFAVGSSSFDSAAITMIVILLAGALIATLVGVVRRARRSRPTRGRGHGRAEVVRLRARRLRRGRTAPTSRDAERLAARIRARTAA